MTHANARKIFNLDTATVSEGEKAEFTLFNPQQETVFTKEQVKSKSQNSAFINLTLKGKVIGIFSKGNLVLNK